MQSRRQKRPGQQDLHFIDDNGMIACNPRDHEAAHRAEVDGIGTNNPTAVTCNKCLAAISKSSKLKTLIKYQSY